MTAAAARALCRVGTGSRRVRLCGLAALALAIPSGCAGDDESGWEHLSPTPNRFEELTSLFEPQPSRARPTVIAAAPDGRRVYISLQGPVDRPGDTVVALDVASRRVVTRYRVGRSPGGLAVHPSGRYLVVANRYSNFVSVIDLRTGIERRVGADYYVERLVFSADGRRLYGTNRWRNSLQVWDAQLAGRALRLEVAEAPDGRHGVPVGFNPFALAVDDDAARVFVAAVSGLTVSAIDVHTLREVDADGDPSTSDFGAPEGVSRVSLGAPANGLALSRGALIVATLSASTHHPPFGGPDTNGDGSPGDGTPNEGFQDLQNEVAVFDAATLRPRVRYTSDSMCCFDHRDVSPSDPGPGALLPDPSTWIVGGALPEDVVPLGASRVAVIYSGSNEVQRFDVTEDGALIPGPLVRVGINPIHGVYIVSTGELAIVNRLSESLSFIDVERFAVTDEVALVDPREGAFPATDVELGEQFYFSGAAFSVDGDQTCNHCHRDRGNVGKVFSMPLLLDTRGSRMTPAARGLVDTRPWFFEGAMDENNFFPVINEFARAENFCCADYIGTQCADEPPAECDRRPYPRNLPTRDAFFLHTARAEFGRERSFGGALDTRIDYLGLTRLLGLFLMHEPALLPNPNDPMAPDAQRGERIFHSAATACASCHPAPGFAVSFEHNPHGVPLRFGPLVTPTGAADGANLDLVDPGFLDAFPMAEQSDRNVLFNPPALAGLWDRAPGFLHDGRARNLREALATPHHAALEPGEIGHNEVDGIPDTHGGTSHLTPDDLYDLIAYLMTL